MRRSTAVTVLAIALAACQTQNPAPPATQLPFDLAAHARYAEKGTGRIEGQAFLKTRGGDVKTAAGNKVTLMPYTHYFVARFEAMQQGQILNDDPGLVKVVHIATADSQGGFAFDNLPPGEYQLISKVTWEAPTQWGLATQGGLVTERLTLKEGQTARVMLTRLVR